MTSELTSDIAAKRPVSRGDGKCGRWFDWAAGSGTLVVGSEPLVSAVLRVIPLWNKLGAQRASNSLTKDKAHLSRRSRPASRRTKCRYRSRRMGNMAMLERELATRLSPGDAKQQSFLRNWKVS